VANVQRFIAANNRHARTTERVLMGRLTWPIKVMRKPDAPRRAIVACAV
jgi:hypothetical protein